MLTALIAILLQLGIITAEADYDNLSVEEQEYYQETIIIEDGTQM